jgi:hypothetical protein
MLFVEPSWIQVAVSLFSNHRTAVSEVKQPLRNRLGI